MSLPPLLNGERLADLARMVSSRGRLDRLVVDSYLGAAGARLRDLADALQAADLARSRLLAHRWRGAAAALGLEQLTAVLGDIEDAGSPMLLAAALPQLERTHDDSCRALQDYRSASAAG